MIRLLICIVIRPDDKNSLQVTLSESLRNVNTAEMNCNLYTVQMRLDTNHSITSATCGSQTPSVSFQRLSVASLSFESGRCIQLEKSVLEF